MNPELAKLMNAQGGVFTRTQAMSCGFTSDQVRHLTRSRGPWVMVRPGAYTLQETWDAAGETRLGRLALTDRAAHFTAEVRHLISHDSAARAWGLNLLEPEVELVHVTREGSGTARVRHGVKHHRTRLGLLNTGVVDWMRVTGLARTAVDIAREHGFVHGLVALDGAMRAGITREDLQAEFDDMWCWPGSCDIRDGIAMADPGADNPAETLTRLMCLEAGFVPETQFPVRLPNGTTVWIDIRLGRHLIEFDGRVKYRSVENGGVARGDVEDVLWDERNRQNLICSQGFGMTRVRFSEVCTQTARRETWLRVAREMGVTTRRFGTELSVAQANFAEAMAGVRLSRIIKPLSL